MSINLTEPETADLTIQQASRRTRLAESALRYYEYIGLIDRIPRDESSGHRRYPRELVTAIESLSCLRGTGMSVQDMRAPELGTLADLLGRPTLVSAGKATKLIAWQPRSAADTVPRPARASCNRSWCRARSQ